LPSLDNAKNNNISRRKFLGLLGGTALGAVIFEACGVPEQEYIIQSPVDMPEDYVKGEDNWYATTSDTSEHGESIIVRIMQGRAKKIEGNPDFPNTLGKHKAVTETEIQTLYHPDRISGPLYRKTSSGNHRPISWSEAESILNDSLSLKGNKSIITKSVRGMNKGIIDEFSKEKGLKHLTLSSLHDYSMYESAKEVFGTNSLPYFDIKNSDLIISFGLDFLGTWGPVEYENQFGKFRSKDHRGYMVQIEPRMSLTAAGADSWLCSDPGREGLIALMIADQIIKSGKGNLDNINKFKELAGISEIDDLNNSSVGLDPKSVGSATGVDYHKLEKFIEKLISHLESKDRGKIIFLAGGATSGYPNSKSINSLVFGLNYLTGSVNSKGGIVLNPDNVFDSIEVNGVRLNLPVSSSWSSMSYWNEEIQNWKSGNQDLIIVRGVDLLNEIPGKSELTEAFNNSKISIGFGSILNDTLERCDLILPDNTSMQSWGSDIPEPRTGYQLFAFGQPVVSNPYTKDGSNKLYDSKSFYNVLLSKMENGLSGLKYMDLCKELANKIYASDSYSNSSIVASNSDDFFKGIMARGGWWNVNKKSSGPKNPKINITNVVSDVKRSSDGFYLIPFKSHVFGDGNSLANPWAQGSPDPITSITWDSWIEINTKTAEGLKIKQGDILEVTSNSGSIKLPAYLHPGVPTNSISIPIGQGKQNFTRYASGRGSNVVDLINSSKLNEDGNISWNSTSVTISKTKEKKKISKFEGSVPAIAVEPGVPILTVGLGESAEEGFHRAHEEHLDHTFGDHWEDKKHNGEKGH
tara:strand:- start:2688 stop:5105 length:2418 start_codon:yes stop_codon:yes gene_type:complete